MNKKNNWNGTIMKSIKDYGVLEFLINIT